MEWNKEIKEEYEYFENDPNGRVEWEEHIEGLKAAIIQLVEKGLFK